MSEDKTHFTPVQHCYSRNGSVTIKAAVSNDRARRTWSYEETHRNIGWDTSSFRVCWSHCRCSQRARPKKFFLKSHHRLQSVFNVQAVSFWDLRQRMNREWEYEEGPLDYSGLQMKGQMEQKVECCVFPHVQRTWVALNTTSNHRPTPDRG